MTVRTAGLSLNDVQVPRLLREQGVEAHRVSGALAFLAVHAETLELLEHGPGARHRPYVHLCGELREARLSTLLPGGIGVVVFGEGQGPVIDAYCEFSDDQLATLVRKGYFHPSFEAAPGMTGVVWDLPGAVDMLVVAAGDKHPEFGPLVFLEVCDAANLSLNDQPSWDFDLTECFPNLAVTVAKTDSRKVIETEAITPDITPTALIDAGDLASSLGLPGETAGLLTNGEQDGLPEALGGTPDFAAQIADLQARVETERTNHKDEEARKEGTLENLYRNWVAIPTARSLDELETTAGRFAYPPQPEQQARSDQRYLFESDMADEDDGYSF